MGKMEGPGMFRPEDKKEKLNKKAAEEIMDGNHFEKLYDENEDRAGQKINEATGKSINNSPKFHNLEDKLGKREISVDESGDIMGKVKEKNDAAAKWLR